MNSPVLPSQMAYKRFIEYGMFSSRIKIPSALIFFILNNGLTYGRRGFLEILAEILSQLDSGPTRKTLLSYKCKLDSRAVSKYLEIMEKIDMVGRSKENQNYFIITKKGKTYLKKYNSLVDPLLK